MRTIEHLRESKWGDLERDTQCCRISIFHSVARFKIKSNLFYSQIRPPPVNHETNSRHFSSELREVIDSGTFSLFSEIFCAKICRSFFLRLLSKTLPQKKSSHRNRRSTLPRVFLKKKFMICSIKQQKISRDIFFYIKNVIAAMTERNAEKLKTSLCLQIVELFDVTSKYFQLLLFHFSFFAAAESRTTFSSTFLAELRTRPKHQRVCLSYAIEFIIIHNLSYFFQLLSPLPSFSFFKLYIFFIFSLHRLSLS